jgi:hypothetical protein
MESFFRLIIRFRFVVIGLVLGCTGLVVVQPQSLRFEGDASAEPPPGTFTF